MEMLLALGVVLTLMAVAWPLTERMTANAQLKRVVEQVRVELAAARLMSIDSGLIYQFRFEPGGRRFVILPFEPPIESSGSTGGAMPVQSEPVRDGQLPEGLTFQDGEVGGTASALDPGWLNQTSNSSQLARTSWSLPFLFYPDGSAADADVVIQNQENWSIRLVIRELTGTVSVAEIESEAM